MSRKFQYYSKLLRKEIANTEMKQELPKITVLAELWIEAEDCAENYLGDAFKIFIWCPDLPPHVGRPITSVELDGNVFQNQQVPATGLKPKTAYFVNKR